MTCNELRGLSEQLKREIEKLWQRKAFDPIVELLHNRCKAFKDKAMDNTAEVAFYAQLDDRNGKKRLVPLAFIAATRTSGHRYTGISFGMVPKLPPNLKLTLHEVSE